MSLDDFFGGEERVRKAWEEMKAEREREEKERGRKELEARIAGKKGGRKPKKASPLPDSALPRGVFAVEDLPDRYRLHGVPYDGGIVTVDWSKGLLDGGHHLAQTEWVELTKDSEWKLAPAPLYHASLTSLYHNRDHADAKQKGLVSKVRRMFADDFGLRLMMTGTHIMYKPRGDGVVTHGFGYGNPREVHAGIVGPCGLVDVGCGFEEEIEALLGTRDPAEVEKVYGWVSGKKPYLWRLNNKPKANVERAVVLGVVGYGRFGIYASVDFDLHGPARGVVVQNAAQKISRGNEGGMR